ncbi:MAG TPA: Fe-S cluster assembly protein SufD [Puia sp.]|nr:Fe-S cluster assembly protein SufD [Puia sp.]
MISRDIDTLYDQFIADFETKSVLMADEPENVREFRRHSFEHFRLLGFPSVKNEEWRYTHIAPFLREVYSTSSEKPGSLDQSFLSSLQIRSLDGIRILLFNGKYLPEFSELPPDSGIHVSALTGAYQERLVSDYLGKIADASKNHFVALNSALFEDGLFIRVQDGRRIERPLHVIHVFSSESNMFVQPRHLFVVGKASEVSLVESFLNFKNEAEIFINDVSEIEVGSDARVQHYTIHGGCENARYIHHTEVRQAERSVYNNYKASFPGPAFLRNNLNVSLNGENIESHLYGLYLAGGRQVVDNHTIVDHLKPNCQSNELYKGVIKDEASGIFNGKIYVRKDAQKTNAFQKNNNLMLGKKAIVDSKPQLEIFADDVKCSHGSTVGQFNEEALFYLKSRGIGEERAKALLIHAFAYDVLEKMPLASVKSHINKLIDEGLKT